ncbi:mitochondrial carrier protein [Raphidocelis subcapitata]|uniref:Mitochondrial carrier protein n=1 Tax=Raphidocelis subcapitata TaxID=307507 RepID=A0A2V0PK25_9CHLO|nr:mitochondrial carrier protein [Raphidocelis subcapitata]|eukprot:GBF98260.1 mitochondrial carrier protein [Raphidocelis subcapitata]
MAPQQEPVPAAFALNGSSGALVVVSSSGRRSGRPGASALAARSAPLAGAVGFTTRAPGGVGRRMLVIKGSGAAVRAPPLPMAALSLSLSPPFFWRKKKEPEAPPAKKKRTLKEVMDQAAKSALRGGLPGMGAMAIQVLSLMWLRTTVNYEYRYGGGMANVEGATGLTSLGNKISKGGPQVLYHGALAASAATFVGHYPWFATYNTLDHYLPRPDADATLASKLLRSAFMGFWGGGGGVGGRDAASLVSDTCSNSIRVVKTAKQTVTTPMGYPEVVKMIIEKDGLGGLFGRGLRTKILANAVQGIMFSVLWRIGQDMMTKAEKDKAAKQKAEEEAAKGKKK